MSETEDFVQDAKETEGEVLIMVRQIIAVVILAICSYTDITERYIYTLPLIIASAGAIIISVSTMLSSNSSGWGQLCDCVILPIIIGITVIVITKHLNGKVGMGDAYLFSTVGLIIGERESVSILVLASFMCGLFGCAVLIVDKERRIRKIPFAPFLLASYVVMITMRGF